ncbi:MAG: hypothetical protein N2C14_22085, partial [Planctomycetales bacterium]
MEINPDQSPKCSDIASKEESLEPRLDLARRLRLLVDGEITNDDFDERYHDVDGWICAQDPAVARIAEFGWALYNEDDPTHKLTGGNAVSPEQYQAVERAILFLRSDFPYEW